jgi:TfoX/Sxy family transcriptional regulator of competence genes
MTAKKKPTMPRWKPAPQDLVSTFERAAGALRGVEVRKMFGYPAAFLGGNMFTGLHEDRMILRLSEEDRALLLQEKGTRIFEPMPGRPMREYVVLPEAILASPPKLSQWLSRAQAYARTLPPKSSKEKKKSPR